MTRKRAEAIAEWLWKHNTAIYKEICDAWDMTLNQAYAVSYYSLHAFGVDGKGLEWFIKQLVKDKVFKEK